MVQDGELNFGDEEDRFLTHSVKEEFEHMKESVVFSVIPEKKIY